MHALEHTEPLGSYSHHVDATTAGTAGRESTFVLVTLEPEVGIEPTTYRLQDGRYPYTLASTSNSSHGLGIMDHSATHRTDTVSCHEPCHAPRFELRVSHIRRRRSISCTVEQVDRLLDNDVKAHGEPGRRGEGDPAAIDGVSSTAVKFGTQARLATTCLTSFIYPSAAASASWGVLPCSRALR
jgi:hypothetical protein